jgi:ppGpp synthetase/RelA/SpoT-type nucleotidyltranferase
MNIIDEFITQYNKEFDYYQKLSQIVANKIEEQLSKRGIKAIVSHRAKRSDRLREKLMKRNEEKRYDSIESIYADIVDLAGIRVSLYFPSEREIIGEVVNELFAIEQTKKFPDSTHNPKHTKRFSGYWATHYRVKLKSESITRRYEGTLAEIQVASVLMHAWSEVEHDLVYKPFSGNLSTEELAILDEINGLVLTGDIALERLQSAMAERTKQSNSITNKYELTNFLINNLDKNLAEKLKLGDTSLLNNYFNTINKFNPKQLVKFISRIDFEAEESITDQLLSMLLEEISDLEKVSFNNYFRGLNLSEKSASGFESFVKCWVIIEKASKEYLTKEEIESRRFFIPNLTFLKEKKLINIPEYRKLQQLRIIRNNLLHGIQAPSDNYLMENFQDLKKITEKVVEKIPNIERKNELQLEILLL